MRAVTRRLQPRISSAGSGARARGAVPSLTAPALSSDAAPDAAPLARPPPGVADDDYARALKELSSQHRAVVELPDSLLRGISEWLTGEDAQSARQLRHSSTRLVEHLRARSRGLPRQEAQPDWAQAPGLLPRSRAALAAMEPVAQGVAAPDYSKHEVSAYAASRLPCTYAVLRRVFGELAKFAPDYRPTRLLDFGAGPGTAALAAADVWPAALRESVAVELSHDMMALADALREATNNAAAAAGKDDAVDAPSASSGGAAAWKPAVLPPARVVPHLSRLRGPKQQRRYDIVVAAYSLGELPNALARQEAVQRLWAHCADVLVIVEPGTPMGSAAVREARANVLRHEARRLRAAGKHHARAAAREAVDEAVGVIEHDAAAAVDADGSTGAGAAKSGVHVVAPCPHDGRCPMDDTAQWCHFVQRVQRPAAQRAVKGGMPARTYQDERFSFVVLRRGARPARGAAVAAGHAAQINVAENDQSLPADASDAESDEDAELDEEEEEERVAEPPASPAALAAALSAASTGWARLVRGPRKRSGHVVMDLCTPAGGLHRRVVAASHAPLLGPGSYRLARKARWGDAWPHPAVMRRTRIAEDGTWVTALEAVADVALAPVGGRSNTLGEQHLE